MTACAFFDPDTGEITSTGVLSDATLEAMVDRAVPVLLDIAPGVREGTHYLDPVTLNVIEYTTEELAAKRSMPMGWIWRMPERVAVDARELAHTKTRKNAEINQKRLEANRTSFAFAGKAIACDELSMLDIQSLNGIVTLIGYLPPGFQKQWKAIDNSYVAIPDKATWIGFIGSMVAAGQANFDHAQALKAALAAATTNTDVDDITW